MAKKKRNKIKITHTHISTAKKKENKNPQLKIMKINYENFFTKILHLIIKNLYFLFFALKFFISLFFFLVLL